MVMFVRITKILDRPSQQWNYNHEISQYQIMNMLLHMILLHQRIIIETQEIAYNITTRTVL